MKTRNRKGSESAAADENVPTLVPVEKKKKVSPKQSTDALVASIINSIKEENIEQKPSADGNKKSNVPKKVAPKTIRGIPKSGRPWKEPKKKWVVIHGPKMSIL